MATTPPIPAPPTVTANGLTYYVDNSIGSDSNTTTQAQNPATPWETLQYGMDQLSAGETLLVMPGSGVYEPNQATFNATGSSAAAWISVQGVAVDNVLPTAGGFRYTTPGTKFVELANFNTLSNSSSSNIVLSRASAEDLYFRDLSIDCDSVSNSCIGIGSEDGGSPASEDPKRLYFHRIEGMNSYDRGVNTLGGMQFLTFNSVVMHHNDADGFSGSTYPADIVSGFGESENFYFVDCVAHDNGGDGFDIGAGILQVHLRCLSYDNGGVQGVGFKVWGGNTDGGDIYVHHCQSYGNDYSGLDIKNLADTNIYLEDSYFALNAGEREITAVGYNNPDYMGVPTLYFNRNIIYLPSTFANKPALEWYNDNIVIAEADYNTVVTQNSSLYCRERDQVTQGILYDLDIDIMPDTATKTNVGYVSAAMEANSIMYNEADGQTEAPAQIKFYPVYSFTLRETITPIDLATDFWSLGDTYTAQNLPAGLGLSTNGTLSGTVAGGSADATVTATNTQGTRVSLPITINVSLGEIKVSNLLTDSFNTLAILHTPRTDTVTPTGAKVYITSRLDTDDTYWAVFSESSAKTTADIITPTGAAASGNAPAQLTEDEFTATGLDTEANRYYVWYAHTDSTVAVSGVAFGGPAGGGGKGSLALNLTLVI